MKEFLLRNVAIFVLLAIIGVLLGVCHMLHSKNNRLHKQVQQTRKEKDRLTIKHNELKSGCRRDRGHHFETLIRDPEWIIWEIAWIEAELLHADALSAARKKELRERKKLLLRQRQKPLLKLNAKQRRMHLMEDIRERRRRIRTLEKHYPD